LFQLLIRNVGALRGAERGSLLRSFAHDLLVLGRGSVSEVCGEILLWLQYFYGMERHFRFSGGVVYFVSVHRCR
jgi:hypothetical protein